MSELFKNPFAPGESPFGAKGFVWSNAIDRIKRIVPGGLDALLDELPENFGPFLTQIFLASGWYDILPMEAFSRASARLLKVDVMDHVAKRAALSAEETMVGVHKKLLNQESPLEVCRRFGSMQHQSYNFGEPQVLHEEENRVEAVGSGMPEPIAWWWKRASEAYLMVVLKAAGAVSPKMMWHPHQDDGMRSGIKLVKIPSTTSWSGVQAPRR